MSSTQDLKPILDHAIKLARQAGQMILDGQKKRFATPSSSTKEKLNSVDLVTEVDQAVEAYLIEEIEKEFPDHMFVGEETYTGQEITDAPTWIVDPIDGTTNFVHGFPFVACSIGVTIDKKPVVGVIYNPFLDQLYYGSSGSGSFLLSPTYSPTPLRLPLCPPQPLKDLSTALVAVEWGSIRKSPEIDLKGNGFMKLARSPEDGKVGKMVHSLRSLGSAALNICQVATGGCDLYHEIGCWPWDVTAGMVILQESGGLSFGSKSGQLSGEPSHDVIVGRKYLFVKAIGDSETESGKDAQFRIMKEMYQVVDEYDL